MATRRILITTGDADGVGTEILSKALSKIGPQPNVQFVAFRSPNTPHQHLRHFKARFQMVTCSSLSEALDLPVRPDTLIDICSQASAPTWVVESAQACMAKAASALVTGPLSKTTIKDAGYRALGHTDLLAQVSQKKDLFMGFVGPRCNVVLITGHIPLKKVSRLLTLDRLKCAVESATRLCTHLSPPQRGRPMAILGLNPHAGESGLIGDEELQVIPALLRWAKRKGYALEGPLVPDAAFLDKNLIKYSLFLCPYHDQGLIPFKILHGQSDGFHITLGLPFLRTSVDHGTAKDLFKKGVADPGSMKSALEAAVQLTKRWRAPI